MKKDMGKPVVSFAATLKGQEHFYRFSKIVKGSSDIYDQLTMVDFTNIVVMSEMIRGLADLEVKAIVLIHLKQKNNLEQSNTLIKARE